MLQIIKKVYRSLPPWVTAPVRYIPDGLLFGKSFRRCVPRIDTACLGENIKRTLDYAREHTAWGRETIPEKIVAEEAEDALKTLPIIGSLDINSDLERYVSDEVTNFNSYTATTGMNKIPTVVRLSNVSYGIEWRHILDIWGRGGYCRRKDLKLTFRSYQFNRGPLFRRDPIYNELSVDPAQQNDENFSAFLHLLRKEHVTCIHGYPTFLKLFMERLREHNEKYPVREIMLGSEGCDVSFKKELQDFFGARILSWYGMTEKVTLAYDEFATGQFVVYTSYGYPWVINPDSEGIGEIVGTTFVNMATPLFNYKTGDFGRIVKKENRIYIESIQGRSGKDFIWLDAQTKFPATPVGFPDCVQRMFVFFQIVQEEYGKIHIRVLPVAGKQKQIVQLQGEILKDVQRQLPGIEISLVWVNRDCDLERSHRGKLMKMVQKLKGQSHV